MYHTPQNLVEMFKGAKRFDLSRFFDPEDGPISSQPPCCEFRCHHYGFLCVHMDQQDAHVTDFEFHCAVAQHDAHCHTWADHIDAQILGEDFVWPR